MTTIAYRDGVLASDSQATECGLKSSVQKIFRLKDCDIAITGELYTAMKFVQWYGNRKEDVTFESDDDFECIIFADGKLYSVDRNKILIELRLFEGSYFAFGSGRDYALGAMKMGATAVEAVKIAAEFDSSTGGDIQTASNSS